MVRPASDNPIYKMHNMGFSVTWSLISMGIDEREKYGFVLTSQDILEYLNLRLGVTKNYEDEIIHVICLDNESNCIYEKIRFLANKEPDQSNLNRRKWRAFLFGRLINDVNCTSADIYDFWITFDDVLPCPDFYPYNAVAFLSKQENEIIELNKRWFADEMRSIIAEDKYLISLYAI